MTYPKNIFSLKNLLFASAAVFFLSSCEQEQELVAVTKSAEVAEAAVNGPNVESLTISGENTNFVETVECSTCTYVVDAKTKVVDGSELGLQPGDVICLDAAVKYGSVDFVNIVGSEEAPITIGTCNK